MPSIIENYPIDMVHRFFLQLLIGSFLLLVAQTQITAQSNPPAKVAMSEAFKVPRNSVVDRLISTVGNTAYFLRRNYNLNALVSSITIESYDVNTLRLKKAINIDLKYRKKLRVFHDVFKVNDKFYLITSFFNSGKDKNYLFAQKLDKLFEPDEDLILIGEIDSRNEIQIGDFEIQHSRDSSKVMIYQDIPTKRSESQQAKVSIYNDNLELLWDRKIKLPYESKLFNNIKFEVDNKGNAYLLGKRFFEKEKDVVKKRPNFEYILEAYTEKGDKVDRYQLNDKLKLITDMTFEVNNKNEIICTGFYTNKTNAVGAFGYSESIQGIVYFKVDNNEKLVEEKTFTKFDLDFITLNATERAKRVAQRRNSDNLASNDPALYSYDFRDVILRSDGGVVIIAEQFFVEEVNRSVNNFNQGFSNQTFSNSNIYNYNEVIIVNIRPDGSIQWANSVPKYQSSITENGRRFLSFANANIGDKIYLIFNEERSILEGSNSFFKNQNALAMAELNKSGELSIYMIGDNDQLQSTIIPTLTKQIARNTLLIYGIDKGRFRIGRVDLK